MRHPDVVSGAVLSLLGIAVVVAAQNIDISQLDSGLSAAFFPTLCGVVLALAGTVIAVRGAFAGREPMPFIADRRVAGIAALFVLYFFSFTYIDFRIGAWAILLASMLVLGARNVKELVVVPVLVAGAVYLLFRHGLQILVPTWI